LNELREVLQKQWKNAALTMATDRRKVEGLVLQLWKTRRETIKNLRADAHRTRRMTEVGGRVKRHLAVGSRDLTEATAMDERWEDEEEARKALGGTDKLAAAGRVATRRALQEPTGEELAAAQLAERTRQNGPEAADNETLKQITKPGSWLCKRSGKCNLENITECSGCKAIQLRRGRFFEHCGGSQATTWGG